MRTVFNHGMLTHVWAQASQSHGRAADGRMFFERGTLYSYGSHFAIGHITESGVALLNTDRYSVSTSKHQRHASSAVSHRECYGVPELTALVRYDGLRNPKTVAAHVEKHALTLTADAGAFLLKLAGARKPESRFASIKAKAEAAAARAKAEAARAKLAGQISRIKELAAAPESRFAEALTAEHSGVQWDSLVSTYRASARAAARHIGPRVKAKAKARIAALEAAAAKAEWIAGRGYRLRDWLNWKAAIRNEAHKPEGRAHAARQLIANGRGMVDAARLTAFAESMDRAAAEAAAKAAAERMEREAAARAAWLAGTASHAVGRLSDARGGALLRAMKVERDSAGAIVAGELQTSWGASVPLTHAVRAFRFLKLCHATGREWNANGRTIRVGHFSISHVTPESFTAGCHTVFWPEVARVAATLGIAELAGDESALVPSGVPHAA